MEQSVITRTVRVAAGRFAPGHIGELTAQVPFEMVDAVLAATRTTQRRVRDLPARVVVYLMLAGCLFAELGYRQVWDKLVAGLHGLAVAAPSRSALTQARQRLGVAPLRALFDLLRGPAPTGLAAGVRFRGLLVAAVDGTTMCVPDSAANLGRYRRHSGPRGASGYPILRLVALVACGTRSIIDAVWAPANIGETTLTPRLLASLHQGMIVLADRNFAAGWLINRIAGTEAHLLIRVRTGNAAPKLPVLCRLADGSYRSRFGGTDVRVIDAQITIATSAGRATGDYRLITTLTDPRRYPATALVQLYHQRWEIETAYLELKHSILGGRVLRARTPTGIDQEIYALLTCYQAIRTAMADATNTRVDLDPDRASFTIAVQAARDQLITAAGVIADTTIDLVGVIGRRVLANLLPSRRLRIHPRVVKRAISKYNSHGPTIDRTTYKATLEINVLAGPALTTGPAP